MMTDDAALLPAQAVLGRLAAGLFGIISVAKLLVEETAGLALRAVGVTLQVGLSPARVN